MSNYIVSARKYRPATFDAVVGQGALTTTLRNSIASGRLAHAYLFCGPRGVGKTTCARIFAKTINCLSPKEGGIACEECESCKAFNEQRSLNIRELDAASNNSVDDIRQLIEQVGIPPQIGRYKVYIVDEVHMLSTAAFNAFLKTLEEPPHYAVFILATTEKHRLLPTIISRCQIYDFSRISTQDIVAHLEQVAEREGITCEKEALNVIAQKADGGMRDALSIFDQVASFCQGHITYQQTLADLGVLDFDYYFRMVDEMLQGKVADILLTLNEVLAKGFEASLFMGGLNAHLRNLLMSYDQQTIPLIDSSEEVKKRYGEQARRCPTAWVYKAIRHCTNCDINYRQSQNKRLLVEITLIEMAQDAQADDTKPPDAGGQPHTERQALKPIFSAPPTPQPTPPAPAQPAPAPQSKATHSVSPAPAPSPPKAAARPAATPPRAATSFSINRGGFPGQKTSGNAPAFIARENVAHQAMNQENLTIAWREFVSKLPQEQKASARRLENVSPVLEPDGKSFSVAADNPSIEHVLQQMKPLVEHYMGETFQEAPAMQIHLQQAGEGARLLSPQEQLTEMKRSNPALSQLIERLSLSPL